MAGTTSRGYRYPGNADTPNVAVDIQNLAGDVNSDVNTHVTGTAAHGVTGAVVGTTDVQALTNKDLTAGTNTFPTSLATLSGTQALSNKDLTAGTNTFPTSLVTLSGTQTLTNKTFLTPQEITTVTATSANTTVNFDVLTQSVLYYTSNAGANFTLVIRGNSGTTLNSLMDVGDALTVVFLNTNGTTAYYASTIKIDATTITPKWQNGSVPSGGNASSVDAYTLTIIKTAATPTYTVFASLTKFV